MFFFGLVRALAQRWCNDGELINGLFADSGGMISAEPARRVQDMAILAEADPTLVELLCTGSRGEIEQALYAFPALDDAYQAYLGQFADRCMEELKLESSTLRDDPLPLLRSIGHLASQQATTGHQHASRVLTEQTEQRVTLALRGHPLRRLLFGWIVRQARARVRARENMRFERTRVFGRVRQIVRELGKRFAALDLLEDAQDIFYLELEEALQTITGAATTANLKGLVQVRKAEFAHYRTYPAPPDRCETYGLVNGGLHIAHVVSLQAEGTERQGLGCCPGVVRGPVRIVIDPQKAEIQTGEILVARRTDPGWVMLFPAAAGLLVERGSLLSHSAIVARELGLPTIVGLADATSWLRNGDWIEMNGSSGQVRKLEEVTHD
jgi:pyruvate,water dikinase